MKIIIFLVLAGLSLAQEEINCPEPPTPKERQECALEALQAGANFTELLRTYICNYNGTVKNNVKEDQNDENYQETGKDLIKGLACAGCSPDDFLDPGDTFENLYRDPARLGTELPSIVFHIEGALGPTPALRNFICKRDGYSLETQCFIRLRLFIKLNPSELQRINNLFCQNELNALTSDQLLDFMMNLGCFGEVTRDALKEFNMKDQDQGVIRKALLKLLYDLLIDLVVRLNLKPCDSLDNDGGDPDA